MIDYRDTQRHTNGGPAPLTLPCGHAEELEDLRGFCRACGHPTTETDQP